MCGQRLYSAGDIHVFARFHVTRRTDRLASTLNLLQFSLSLTIACASLNTFQDFRLQWSDLHSRCQSGLLLPPDGHFSCSTHATRVDLMPGGVNLIRSAPFLLFGRFWCPLLMIDSDNLWRTACPHTGRGLNHLRVFRTTMLGSRIVAQTTAGRMDTCLTMWWCRFHMGNPRTSTSGLLSVILLS
jgi:hypothetical protein